MDGVPGSAESHQTAQVPDQRDQSPHGGHDAPAITEITDEILGELPTDTPFDFFREVGLRLPGYVVMDLLGVPRQRLAEVKQWSDEMMLFIGSSRGVEDKYGRAKHGAESMAGLFRGLIDDRRQNRAMMFSPG